MKKTIYVKLLDEGTMVYRPVPARMISNSVFQLEGDELFDPEIELWEFLPGAIVKTEVLELSGGFTIVAVEQISAGLGGS